MINKFQKNSGESYPQKIFAHQLITTDDVEQFRKKLMEELLAALKYQSGIVRKKWMKSQEGRRLLKKSPGVILYTKMGGVHFYDHEDIQKVLESGNVNSPGKSSR